MINLYFPQLSTGALVHYPIQRTLRYATTKNVLADGSTEVYPEPHLQGKQGMLTVWRLAYTNLSAVDIQLLQSHYANCSGPFKSFTFIDPVDNMLAASTNLQAGVWSLGPNLKLVTGQTDINGGNAAVLVANTGQAPQELAQSVAVPAGYQYCFSIYAKAAQVSPLTLVRRGSTVEADDTFTAGTAWSRCVSVGKLSDVGTTLTVAIRIATGEQILLFGPQLEAQMAPSGFRASVNGGVYSNAHWGESSLQIVAQGPDQFDVTCVVEASA